MPPSPAIIIEIYGEGKTDVGVENTEPEKVSDKSGVIPILVYRLCDEPATMVVKRKKPPYLKNKSLKEKVKFVRRQAGYNQGTSGVVFVMDTEGKSKTIDDLKKGRDESSTSVPMAVGVAHPCIEAWLLVDADVIFKAIQPTKFPTVPEDPESLPAPSKDKKHNPKTVLAACKGENQDLKSSQKWQIAYKMKNIDKIKERCPQSYAPFAS